jgi:hypothetical protein
VDSPRNDAEGMGLALGESGGLLSFCVNRPAIVLNSAQDRESSEFEVRRIGEAGRL